MRTFSIDLEVKDEQQLYRAACRRAYSENRDTEEQAREYLMRDGEIDVSACLMMLLDPGSLEGCEIEQSYVS
jgi:hypothetical protein